MNAISFSVNVGRVVVIPRGGADILTILAIIQLVELFALRGGGAKKNQVSNCPHALLSYPHNLVPWVIGL